MSKKWIAGAALAVSLSVISACGGDGESDSGEEQAGDSQQEESTSEGSNDSSNEEGDSGENGSQKQEMPEPDLSDIPDVVAEVNGEEISKSEFETRYVSSLNAYASQGINIEEQDQSGELRNQLQQMAVDHLIRQKLLIQEADNQDITASEEEVNEELTSLKEQFGSDEEFQNTLESQEVSEKELQEDIRKQVKFKKLVEAETGEVEITDEEVKEMYNQMVQAQGGGEDSQSEEGGGEDGESSSDSQMPSLEDMRPQIEKQLTTQKQNEQVQSLVEQLREEGDVSVNL
ncbi:SurA N-terminal domain-containing protein [Salibacterium sp. K-3]